MYTPFHQGSLQERSVTSESVSCLVLLFLNNEPRAGRVQQELKQWAEAELGGLVLKGKWPWKN